MHGPAGRGARARRGESGAVRTAPGPAPHHAWRAWPKRDPAAPAGRGASSSAAQRSSLVTRPENTALHRHCMAHTLVLLNFGHVIEHIYTAADVLIKAWGTFFLLYICSS